MTPIQRLDVPFELRGHHGLVHVELSLNDDPVALGHDLLARGFDAERFKGFPVVLAGVEYSGRGLRATMGWLQVIRHLDLAGIEMEFALDRSPLFADNSPLYAYGYLPTFFDAPANPDHVGLTWQADTWLVAIVDAARTRTLAALTGFRWGYRMTERPSLLGLAPLERGAWQVCLPALRRAAPGWEFLS